jgi:hypothetical protein
LISIKIFLEGIKKEKEGKRMSILENRNDKSQAEQQ